MARRLIYLLANAYPERLQVPCMFTHACTPAPTRAPICDVSRSERMATHNVACACLHGASSLHMSTDMFAHMSTRMSTRISPYFCWPTPTPNGLRFLHSPPHHHVTTLMARPSWSPPPRAPPSRPSHQGRPPSCKISTLLRGANTAFFWANTAYLPGAASAAREASGPRVLRSALAAARAAHTR